MKEFIVTLALVGMLSSGHCSQQDTYNVDSQGSVSKGAAKRPTSSIIIKDVNSVPSSVRDMPKMDYMILR